MVHISVEKRAKQKHLKHVSKLHNTERSIVKKLVQFCKRTDLHGYKYIVMEDLNFYERSSWAFAVLVSIACAAYFVIIAYRWYARNPIVTVIESTQGAVWDIPFPAITICDLNIISRKAARALADNVTLPNNMTADFVFETLRLVPLLHESFGSNPEEKEDLQQLQLVLDLNNISIESLFKRLSPASICSQMLERCMWKNIIYRCDDMFDQIFTMLGLCCTFNYFAFNSDRQIGDSVLSKPRRVASCGYQTALTVLLNINPDDYYSATIASQGILVMIEGPYNIPDLDSPVRLVNPSTEVLIALSPEWTYTSSGIKAFDPQSRRCYYSDEVKVGHFYQYSFHNCMAYQKFEVVRKVCGCVPVHYPHRDLRTCDFRDMSCLEYVLYGMVGNETKMKPNFECLPECEHFDYPLEVALGRLADNVYVNGLPFFDDVSLENRSLLNVFFNDLVSTRYRRDVYLNWQNIFAAYGGLLSLMLGFTLISGFDLILFFTLRIIYDYFNSMVNKNKVHYVKDVNKRKNINRAVKSIPSIYDQKAFGTYDRKYY